MDGGRMKGEGKRRKRGRKRMDRDGGRYEVT